MLKMTRIQEQHRGLYSCLASNTAGEVRRNFSVEVLGASGPMFPAPDPFPPAWELMGQGWGQGAGLLR